MKGSTFTFVAAAPAPTPAEILATNVVLTLSQVATVLNLRTTRGRHAGAPSIRQALALVEAGHLHPVDRAQPVGRMTVACAEVTHYLGAAAPSPVLEDQ